jgi:hypothetical protein
MAFLATLLAYVGTVAGVVLALLMPLCAFLSTASQPMIPHQTVAIAPKPSGPKPAPSTPAASTKIGPHVVPAIPEGRAAPQLRNIADADARKAQLANDTSRDQYFHRPERQDRAKHWAYQLVPDFEARYMGYVNEPSADSSRFQ